MNRNFVYFDRSLFILLLASVVGICLAGFACLEDPCHHGVCMDDLNSPRQCYCQNGYTGYSCEQNWDDCRSWGPSPCRNGGTCLDGIDSFNCSCPEPFSGRLCDIDLSTCHEVFPCENNGTCAYSPISPHQTGLVCLCPPGFTGTHCEEDISVCNTTLNVCLNGGKCIDGIGHKFSCQCPRGWNGTNCEVDINECASNPCQNDGICVDKIGDYGCACHRGFTGKSCETKLETCLDNPCLNAALCLVEGGNKVCYCVPDFHGKFCEQRYDECEPPNKCFNGGTCLDGVGTFTCSCPPEFYGTSCECNFGNVTDECVLVMQSLNLTVPTGEPGVSTSGPIVIASVYPGILKPPIDASSSMALFSSVYDPGGRGGLGPTIVDSTVSLQPTLALEASISLSIHAADFSSILMSTPIIGSAAITTYVEETADLGKTEKYEPCPSLELTALMSPIETEFMLPSIAPPYSSEMLTPSASVLDSNELVSEFPSTGLYVSPRPSASFGSELWELPESSLVFTTVQSDVFSMSSMPGLSLEPTAGVSVTAVESLVEPTPGGPRLEPSLVTIPALVSSLVEQSASGLGSVITTALPPSILSSLMSEDVISSLVEATVMTTTIESSLPPASPTMLLTSGFPVEETASQSSPVEPTASLIEPSVTQLVVSEMSPLVATPAMSSEFEYMTSVLETTAILVPSFQLPIGPSSMTPPAPLSSSSVISEPVLPSVTVPPPLITSHLPVTEEPIITSASPTIAAEVTTAGPNLTDPCLNFCLNDAKCVFTSVEPVCICPFKFKGIQCEQKEEEVVIPSFSGSSFLKYVLPRASPNIIDISSEMATVYPEGILMYASIGQFYALLFIQQGHLSLHFSCGSQSMHFVETRTRVDDGFNFTVSFRLENEIQGNGELRCIGQVSLNGSYSMRGEQVVDLLALKDLEQPMKTVFLGGLDDPHSHSHDDAIRLTPGFRGCVYKLLVNQDPVAMYDEAKNGRAVAECSTFACVVNPCVGDSKCVASTKHPFWQCICPPGFGGPLCNLRECVVNSCENGATCTMEGGNGTKEETVCLCPLGFSGDKCQSRLTVTKPKFNGRNDYSSYLAYGLVPRMAEWMQLKFHFITQNMSQISLLMYTGAVDEGPGGRQVQVADYDSEKPSDFFAISFLQGYIALTWNLGSGTQRIATPSRVDSHLNVHTVFAGRRGRQAWLKVDGMRNSTGKSPGVLHELNVYSDLYVGGHEVPKFQGLPHDLPLHEGFRGCIFDLGFRVKNRLFLPKPVRGRHVSNCYDDC